MEATINIEQLRSELSEELEKQEKQRIENIRRRHNYLPFVVILIKALAQKNLLTNLRKIAEERKQTQSQSQSQKTSS